MILVIQIMVTMLIIHTRHSLRRRPEEHRLLIQMLFLHHIPAAPEIPEKKLVNILTFIQYTIKYMVLDKADL